MFLKQGQTSSNSVLFIWDFICSSCPSRPTRPSPPSRPRCCWWSSPSMPKGPAHSAGRLLGQNHHGLPFRLHLESILNGKKNFHRRIWNLSKTAPGILEYCGPGTKPPWGVDPPGPGRGEPGPPGPPGGPPGPLGIAVPGHHDDNDN